MKIILYILQYSIRNCVKLLLIVLLLKSNFSQLATSEQPHLTGLGFE